MTHLTIATFNTWNCQGPFARRLALMTQQLKALDADILLLQEVFAEVPSGLDVARRFAADLGMHVVYTPARKKLRKREGVPVLCHSGLAMLARAPLHVETVRLPDDARDGERLGQVAQLDWAGLHLAVANVHLTHLQDADDLRRRQLAALTARIPEAQDLVVLGGDLNLPLGHVVLDAALGADGFTAVQYATPPTSTLNPVDDKQPTAGVIDHIFVKPAPKIILAATAHTALDLPALDRIDPQTASGEGLFPSDHKAVAARFEID